MSESRNKYMEGVYPLDKGVGLFKRRGIFTGKFVNNIFKPSWIYRWLKPKHITGNEINGLGEAEPRQARKAFHWIFIDHKNYPFLWANWIFILRGIFMKRATKSGYAAGVTLNRKWTAKTKKLNKDKPLLRAQPVEHSKEEWGKLIKQKAREFGAIDVGIAKITDDMIYEGKPVPGKYIVIVTAAMDYESSKDLPAAEAGAETMVAYAESSRIGYELTEWLHTQGVPATGSHFLPDSIILPLAGVRAGVGQLGKHGSLISPKTGALTRLNYVALDLELPVDEMIDFGVDEFCTHCQVCTINCPPQAMLPEKQTVRGAEKWYVDFDKCVPYFIDTNGCGRCIAVCPWSRPSTIDGFLQRMVKNKVRLAELAEQRDEKQEIRAVN